MKGQISSVTGSLLSQFSFRGLRFPAPRTPPPWVCRPCYPALAPCAGPQVPFWPWHASPTPRRHAPGWVRGPCSPFWAVWPSPYTPKINQIFSDLQNLIFHFDIAALDVMSFEWPDIFPRSQINLPFVICFVFLGEIGETKLIREATLNGHISCSQRGIPISRILLELLWSQLNLGSIRRLNVYTCSG